MSGRIWRLKFPPQPLVFCFTDASALLGGIKRLYQAFESPPAGDLCLYRGKYYLAVHCGLLQRRAAVLEACEFGACLGAARVRYAYYAEHGRELSRAAITQLGR